MHHSVNVVRYCDLYAFGGMSEIDKLNKIFGGVRVL